MGLAYKDLLPVANGLIIAGLLFGNLPYDARTLFTYEATEEAFANSLRHYQTWANIPIPALWILHFFVGLGFIGCFIRLYRPTEDSKYYDYGQLFLYIVATCIYLTNLRTGAQSAVHGEWGEVDQNTGINVIGASSAMAIFVLGGIVMLQVGLYYGEWDYQQRLAAFNEEEAERLAEEEKAPKKAANKAPKKEENASKVEPLVPETSEPVKATGAKKTKQTARKRAT